MADTFSFGEEPAPKFIAFDSRSKKPTKAVSYREFLVLTPTIGALLANSTKQLEINGIIGPVLNATQVSAASLQQAAVKITNIMLQDATETGAPVIPVYVVWADLCQVIFAGLATLGFLWHRLKNEPSRLGLINQTFIAGAAFVFLAADAGVNSYFTDVLPALIAKDIAVAVGGAGLLAQFALEFIHRCKGKPIWSRTGAEKVFNDLQLSASCQLGLKTNTLFFSSAAAMTYAVKQISYESLRSTIQQTPIALTAVQASTAGVAWVSYMFGLVLDRESTWLGKLPKALMATSGLGWMISDALVQSIPASAELEVAKGIFSGVFLLSGAAQVIKLATEALTDHACCGNRQGYASL